MTRPFTSRQTLLLATFLALAATLRAAEPKLDLYGDPLPAGALLRLGTTRFQAESMVTWTKDGKSLLAIRSGELVWWNVADGKQSDLLPIGLLDSYGELSADGRALVCARRKGDLTVVDLETRKVERRPREDNRNDQQAIALAVAPDGKTFATIDGEKLELRIWDTATLTTRRTVPLQRLGHYRTPLVHSPDGTLLATATAKSVWLVPTLEGAPIELGDLHGEGAFTLLFTGDSKNLLTLGRTPGERMLKADGTPFIRNQPQLRAWKLASRRMLFELTAHENERDSFAVGVAPDDRTLVTAHRDRIQVWDLARRAAVRKIDGVRIWEPIYTRVLVDPTQTYVAVSDEQFVRIWNLTTGQPHLMTDQHHNSHINRVAWSPDGSVIATGGREIWLWDAESGKPLRSLEPGRGGAWHLEFTPDSKRLLVGGDEFDETNLAFHGGLRVFDINTGALLSKHNIATRVRQVGLSPDGKEVAVATRLGADDAFAPTSQGVRIMDLESGKSNLEFHLPAGNVAALAWADGGRKITFVDDDATAGQVNTVDGTVLLQFQLPHPVPDPMTGMLVPGGIGKAALFRSGHSLVSVGGQGDIYHWLVETGQKQWEFPSGSKYIRALAVSPDERLVAGYCSHGDLKPHKVRIWDLVTRKQLQEIDVRLEVGDSMAFSPGGSRLVVGFYDGTALIYDVSEAVGKLE